MSPRQTNRSTRWASAAEKHAVRASRFAWMSVRMAVRIGAAPEYTARARTSSAPGAALSPFRKRLLQRQIVRPLRPAAQLVRVVVEGLGHVDPSLPRGTDLSLDDVQRLRARKRRQLSCRGGLRQPQGDASPPHQREDAALRPERRKAKHALLLHAGQPLHRIEEERHQIGVEAHATCAGSASKWTSWRKESNLCRTCARSRSRSRSRLNCSTVKEAMVDPITVACRSAAGSFESSRSSRPRKPPAKVSPAPVGSTTSASGKAGA